MTTLLPLTIGKHTLRNNVIAAPMAGVTDACFRKLCFRGGAGMVVTEMVSGDPRLWQSQKSIMRRTHDGESYPRSVQIAGADPQMMAETAKYNQDQGADIIDINMGCPAKKVCNKAAGSALLRDEKLVADILSSVVKAVQIPVTLKMRTGWDPDNRNGVTIAQIAQEAGIAAIAIHGRTRSEKYTGMAEYDTIKAIKNTISIPVIANGDINSPKKAKFVLEYTHADAIMIGRAAQGRPWLFQEIDYYLRTGEELPPASNEMIKTIMVEHLENLYSLYGEYSGVRIARKHLAWYCRAQQNSVEFCQEFNQLEDAKSQMFAIEKFFNQINQKDVNL